MWMCTFYLSKLQQWMAVKEESSQHPLSYKWRLTQYFLQLHLCSSSPEKMYTKLTHCMMERSHYDIWLRYSHVPTTRVSRDTLTPQRQRKKVDGYSCFFSLPLTPPPPNLFRKDESWAIFTQKSGNWIRLIGFKWIILILKCTNK